MQENSMGGTTTNDQANRYQHKAHKYHVTEDYLHLRVNEPEELTLSLAYLPTDVDKLPPRR